MMTKPRGPNCCLCGLRYKSIGNNPAPLSMKKGDRCCDACNEVVIEARIDPKRIVERLTLVEHALRRAMGDTRRMAIAAICASRGRDLLAEKKAQLAQLHALREREGKSRTDFGQGFPEGKANDYNG
jgi:hypothetical protein